MNRPLAHLRPKRAVLYLRQSTFREESISLELQENAGREYCRKMGYDVVAVEADPGISGRTWKRPAVQRVMGMIEAGEADAIVLWRWSRLSRNRKDWALAADRADLAGGSIESATEPNDATAAGRFARGVMTELAAFESERIGEQWKEAHARRRRLGLPADGSPRYGYRKTAEGGYEPDPVQGPILAEMYRRYLRGEGFTRITKWLNTEGIPASRGGTWSRVSVTHLLDTGFGAGKIIQRTVGKGAKRYWNPTLAAYHPGAHEPLITAAEWDEYLAKRHDAPAPPASIEPKYMLTGMIFCDECESPMHAGNQGLVDYKCSGATQRGGTARGLTMKRTNVEAAVRAWVEDLATDIDAAVRIEELRKAQRVIQMETAESLDRRISALKDQMGRITVRWSEGKMPDAAYDVAIQQMDRDLAAMQIRRREAAPRSPLVVDATSVARGLVECWDEAETIELRNLLRSLIHQVRVRRPLRLPDGTWRERVVIIPTWDQATPNT